MVPYGGFDMTMNPYRQPNAFGRSPMNFFTPRAANAATMGPDPAIGIANAIGAQRQMLLNKIHGSIFGANANAAGTAAAPQRPYGIEPFAGATRARRERLCGAQHAVACRPVRLLQPPAAAEHGRSAGRRCRRGREQLVACSPLLSALFFLPYLSVSCALLAALSAVSPPPASHTNCYLKVDSLKA
jgi:hypothetical protein